MVTSGGEAGVALTRDKNERADELPTIGNSSVSVRFVLTKWANGIFLFDYVGQWKLFIWSK